METTMGWTAELMSELMQNKNNEAQSWSRKISGHSALLQWAFGLCGQQMQMCFLCKVIQTKYTKFAGTRMCAGVNLPQSASQDDRILFGALTETKASSKCLT